MAPQESTPEAATEPQELPGFPLNQEFLEFSFGKDVETFSVTSGTNPGDNYLSIMHAVEVVFKGDQETKYYLVKCYPNHPGRRDFLDQVNVFEKELFMYNDFFPEIQQMVKDSGADEGLTHLSLAPYHGGNVMVASSKKFKGTAWEKENFIIMTDLRKEKYRMADRTKGLDLDHALLVIKEMAKFHALTWAYKERNGLELLSSKYPRFIDHMYDDQTLCDQFQGLMSNMGGNAVSVTQNVLGVDYPGCVNFKKFLDSDTMSLMKKFVRPHGLAEEFFEEMLRVKPGNDESYNKEPWMTVLHGDCWVNNMLFRYDQSDTKPVDVTFVDFQICREACPTIDMAYYFYSSIRAPLRNAHKDELLAAYYSSFLMYCNEFQVKPFPGFSFSNLKRRLRRSELFGLMMSIPLLNVVLKPPSESIDMDKSEATDMVELFSKVLEGSENDTNFQDEMAANVLNLYENGVL